MVGSSLIAAIVNPSALAFIAGVACLDGTLVIASSRAARMISNELGTEWWHHPPNRYDLRFSSFVAA